MTIVMNYNMDEAVGSGNATDPKSGREWQVVFENGRLNGWACTRVDQEMLCGYFNGGLLVGPYIVEKEEECTYVVREHPDPTNGFLLEVEKMHGIFY